MNQLRNRTTRSRRACCLLLTGLCLSLIAGIPALADDSPETTTPTTESASTTAPSAAASADAESANGFIVALCWLIALGGSIVALVFARNFYFWMIAQDPGDARMVEIAGYVKRGADAYLRRQYKVVLIFFAVVCVILSLTAYFGAQSAWVPVAFLSGGFFSALAGWYGMKTATAASSRTAQACKESLNAGLQVAFRSGAVMGLTVVGLGLIDICVWFAILYWIAPMFGATLSLELITVTMLCFGMGASSQALFARVGGGIFTKAADVGADLVGKVEAGIPEDDPRNPATIADNVGDNVGDVAGMGADLYESYCGSILATAALGVAAYAGHERMQIMTLLLPMMLAAVGIGMSILGIYMVKTEEGASQKNLLRALGRGINISSLGIAAAAFLLVILMLVWPSSGLKDSLNAAGLRAGWELLGVFFSIIIGLAAGVVIGWWTEYSTSDVYMPTKHIADQAVTGPATVIIAGIAQGMESVWAPIMVIGAAIMLAFGAATGFNYSDPGLFAMGLYGVSIAAVGMLSTLGITLATDAYGPIADNAGGNAEMSHQDPSVRHKTDALDSLGNTTAATGKGFAIGSAALTALALLAAYLEEVRIGFDRWADKAEAVSVVTSDDGLDEAHVRRLSSTVLATTFEREEGKKENEAFLLFPSAVRLGALSDEDAADLPPSLQAARRDLTLIKGAANGVEVGEPVDLKMLMATGMATELRTATMPDFVQYYNVTVMNPKVMIGMFLGVMLTFVFCAMTMKAVGRAAKSMVEEVRRQFREITGIMEGTATPDYAACVEISTAAAQKEMVIPSCLALAGPLAIGMLLGVPGVVGMLAGGLTSGFAVAIMMANAGGAWDNAKKYIESGAHGGKGTLAHKAAVVGDTVGDPFKDTSGPSLNILIKLMSMVSVVFAGLVVQYALNL